jgi:phosphoadenosine phosphosulfate reductase
MTTVVHRQTNGSQHLHGGQQAQVRVDMLNSRYGRLPADKLLRALFADRDAGRMSVVSSFGTESAVLLHFISRIAPDTPVLFVDSGKLFRETLDYADELTETLGLTNVRRIMPGSRSLRETDPHGDLWQQNTLACCQLRKVVPLRRALGDFDLWITGRKRFHSQERSRLQVFEAEGRHVKVNPLAAWSADDIATYAYVHELPEHPLTSQGYSSVGCQPCTTPVAPGEDIRAGRWRGEARTECGIHTSLNSG